MVRVGRSIKCLNFPCVDVKHESCIFPDIEIDPSNVSIMMISESAPDTPADFYYEAGDSLFKRTTIQAFNDAGAAVSSVEDILGLGVYLTAAVKCAKTEYGIQSKTIEECSHLLEKEIALFPNVKAFILMGDVAIKALNTIARRNGEKRVIPAGSTYKIRGQEYFFRGKRAFPSYLQAGPSFFIEKSKRRMIAEDIKQALSLVKV
jgi:uracil-DNA glycosylase